MGTQGRQGVGAPQGIDWSGGRFVLKGSVRKTRKTASARRGITGGAQCAQENLGMAEQDGGSGRWGGRHLDEVVGSPTFLCPQAETPST